jgi:pilus assembly protein CpaE
MAIRAHCEAQHTADMLRSLAGRRRFRRACLSLEMGGLETALARDASEPAPELLIIESTLNPENLLAGIDRLVALCREEVRIIVIGHVNDVILYRELLKRRVGEYLVGPVSPDEMSDSIDALLGASPATEGQVIAFIGARGGAGSSTVCHNIGWAISKALRADTTIVDFDLQFGTTGLDFNQDPPRGLVEALAAADRLDERRMERCLSKCAENLSLLASPAVLDCGVELEPAAAERIVELLRRSRSYVALDIPHQWNEVSRRLSAAADAVVVTGEPDLANLRNARNLLEHFECENAAGHPLHLVLNKVGAPGRPEIGVEEFARTLGVQPSAVVGFDAHIFGAAANNGLMIEEAARKSRPAAAFRALAGTITGEFSAGREPGRKSRGLFGRWRRALAAQA